MGWWTWVLLGATGWGQGLLPHRVSNTQWHTRGINIMNTQQDLSKQDLSRRAWKPGSGTPAGKRQLQVPRDQLCQDILEWAGSLPCRRGTLGLWDREGTYPSTTSARGMFWDATPKSKQHG